MKVNGTNYYIGRSQSGSYITSDSILSTRISTRTLSGYSKQSNTYTANIYTNIRQTEFVESHEIDGVIVNGIPKASTYTSPYPESFYSFVHTEESVDYPYRTFYSIFYITSNIGGDLHTLTSTSNAYYTTIITNAVNTTVSTTKSASSSSHNFV